MVENYKEVREFTTVYHIPSTRTAQQPEMPNNQLAMKTQEIMKNVRMIAKEIAEGIPTEERRREDEIMNAETSIPTTPEQ